jgi:hypothetical protein
MDITYTNICHCKTLQNLPTFRFLVWKYRYHLATLICSWFISRTWKIIASVINDGCFGGIRTHYQRFSDAEAMFTFSSTGSLFRKLAKWWKQDNIFFIKQLPMYIFTYICRYTLLAYIFFLTKTGYRSNSSSMYIHELIMDAFLEIFADFRQFSPIFANFRQFSPIFDFLLECQCYDQYFEFKITPKFWRNIFKIITSVPGEVCYKKWNSKLFDVQRFDQNRTPLSDH